MKEFNGTTVEELKDFLRKAKGKNGKPFDVKTFDTRSVKTLAELLEEKRKREIGLVIGDNGRVYRTAQTIKLLVYAEYGHYLLRERRRIYPNGKRVMKHNPGSLSETRIRGETSYKTAVRALEEEAGIVVSDWQITPIRHDLLNDGEDDKLQSIEEYESTAYVDVVTIANVEWLEVHLKIRPWTEEYKTLNDNGVLILVKWEDTLLDFMPIADRILRKCCQSA